MKNSFESTNPQEDSPEKHPDYNLIAEKILISRAATTEQFGSLNVYKAAEILYASLYNPEDIEKSVKPNEKFPDRIEIMKKELGEQGDKIPSKEEFIAKVRHAMTMEVDFGKCLSNEAREQFKKVLEKSESAVIWTNGDYWGVPEENIPGSKEQLKKIASARFYNRTRKEIAKNKEINYKDVLSIMAGEGKIKFIPQIVENFRKRGISKLIIIEDMMENILKASNLIKENDENMEIFPVWVRVGAYKNKVKEGKSLEEWSKKLHAIENISELEKVLDENSVFEGDKKVGSIFDLDGPLHNDDKRKEIQTEAVIKALQKEGWI